MFKLELQKEEVTKSNRFIDTFIIGISIERHKRISYDSQGSLSIAFMYLLL